MTGASDDEQAGVEVTEADRARAAMVWQGLVHRYEEADVVALLTYRLTDAIAVALAAEREKARAPFRQMALDVHSGDWTPSRNRLADAMLHYTGSRVGEER